MIPGLIESEHQQDDMDSKAENEAEEENSRQKELNQGGFDEEDCWNENRSWDGQEEVRREDTNGSFPW